MLGSASPDEYKSKMLWAVLLVWFCFIARGLFYIAMVPMWEGFDEHSHFAYIQHVMHTGALPDAKAPVSRELEESLKLAPVPWLLREVDPSFTTHDRYWMLPAQVREQREASLNALPQAWGNQPGKGLQKIYEAQQPPLYYWLMSLPLRAASEWSLPARVFLIRIISLLLASLAIPTGFLLTMKVWRNREYSLGIAALISIMPGIMADICRVGNDSLALFVYTGTIYASLHFFENPRIRMGGLLLALSLGLGLITKAYFLTAVPAIGAVVLFNLRGKKGRILMARGAIVILLALILSAWWYIRNLTLTGAWSGLMQDVSLKNTSLLDLIRKAPEVDWVNALKSTLLSHIWFGNWSFLQVRSWMYQIYQYMGMAALIGFFIYWIRSLYRRLPDAFPYPGSMLTLSSFYAFFCLGICYHVLITFAVHNQSSSAGWYFYSLIFPQTLLIMAGLAIVSPSNIRAYLVPAAVISFGLLDIYTVHFISIPYYTGLIRHKANGFLESFYLSQIQDVGAWEIFSRLSVNKAFLGPLTMMVIWLFYLAAAGALFMVIMKTARKIRM